MCLAKCLEKISKHKEEQKAKELSEIKQAQELKELERKSREDQIKAKIMSRSQEIKQRGDEIKQRTKEILSYTPLYKRFENDDKTEETTNKSHYASVGLPQIIKDGDRKDFKKMREERKLRDIEMMKMFDPKKYKESKFQLEYAEREKLRKLEMESAERKKLDLVGKKKKFSQIVSMTFKPKISIKKKREVELRILLESKKQSKNFQQQKYS